MLLNTKSLNKLWVNNNHARASYLNCYFVAEPDKAAQPAAFTLQLTEKESFFIMKIAVFLRNRPEFTHF